MDSESVSEFNQLAAETRAATWPVTVTITTYPASPKKEIKCSGTPPSQVRVPDDSRAGYVLKTLRNFSILRSALPAGATLALGAVITITADRHNPATVGTSWSVSELFDSNAGAEMVVRTFRQDN